MMKIILSIILLFSFTTHAQSFETITQATTAKCKKAVTYLLEKQMAPCTGYLFSPAKEYEIRVKEQQHDILKDLTVKQGEVLEIMDQRIQNMQKYNAYLSSELEKKEKYGFVKSFLYFGLGVLVTGAIATNVR